MSDKLNGGLVRRALMTALIGMLVAILVARFLGHLFQQVEAQIDFALLAVGFSLIVALIVQTTRVRKKTKIQKGEPESTDSMLEGIVTAVAIGLLFLTSMLSGPYLFLVPVGSITLIIIYLIIKIRRGKPNP